MGQTPRAHELLQFFMQGRRPESWNQWAEVVEHDPRQPHFLGDMPHCWVASDFVRSLLDMLAYEREQDDALVIGAGLTGEWAAGGIAVKGLSTAYGRLGYSLRPSEGGFILQLAEGLEPPRGGVRLAWPLPGRLPRARQGDVELAWSGRELALPRGPATVRLLSKEVRHEP
jgi:hypothetical protein